MQQVPLNSRLISSVAYNPDSQTLHVWLQDRRHLVHHNISEAIYNNLISADSAGFYYTCYIAPEQTPGRRQSARIIARLLAAGLISMLLVSLSATSITGLS